LRLVGIDTDAANFATTLVASAFSLATVLVSGGTKFIDRFVQSGDFFFGERSIATFWKIPQLKGRDRDST
jgi:hypothetical protein